MAISVADDLKVGLTEDSELYTAALNLAVRALEPLQAEPLEPLVVTVLAPLMVESIETEG